MKLPMPRDRLCQGGFLTVLCTVVLVSGGVVSAGESAVDNLERVRLSTDGQQLVLARSGSPFVPWGFNYDHDSKGQLLEDYWHSDWDRVVGDFQEMKALGVNVVRIHLQVGKFLISPNQPNEKNLKKLEDLVKLAEATGLYLDITGLGCYHKEDVPKWYDSLEESERWNAQAFFWQTVARTVGHSPAVFCYDLMNEPVVPVGSAREQGWLVGKPLGGKYFVQRITLEQGERSRAEIAAAWVRRLHSAIREVDKETLITVGLLPGTPDRADTWSGFRPKELIPMVDFICVHIYPEAKKVDEAIQILSHFAVGRPVVIEETFPLHCGTDEFQEFLAQSRKFAEGWISFYWGTPIPELRRNNDLQSAILAGYLELWSNLAASYRRP